MYLNVIQLAESLGVEESVVDGWVRNEGLPCVRDRGRLLFDRNEVVAWAAERGLAAKAGFLAPAPKPAEGMRFMRGLLEAGGIWRGVTNRNLLDVLEKVVARLPGASDPICRMLRQRLHSTGGITWAPVGGGLALPHLRSPIALGRDSGLIACIFLDEPLKLDEPAPDPKPVTNLLFFIAPSPRAHLEILSQLSVSLTRGTLRSLLRRDTADEQLFQALGGAGRATPGTQEAVA